MDVSERCGYADRQILSVKDVGCLYRLADLLKHLVRGELLDLFGWHVVAVGTLGMR